MPPRIRPSHSLPSSECHLLTLTAFGPLELPHTNHIGTERPDALHSPVRTLKVRPGSSTSQHLPHRIQSVLLATALQVSLSYQAFSHFLSRVFTKNTRQSTVSMQFSSSQFSRNQLTWPQKLSRTNILFLRNYIRKEILEMKCAWHMSTVLFWILEFSQKVSFLHDTMGSKHNSEFWIIFNRFRKLS